MCIQQTSPDAIMVQKHILVNWYKNKKDANWNDIMSLQN